MALGRMPMAPPGQGGVPGQGEASVPERVVAELHKIREDVTGVFGSVVATSDGFAVAADVPDLEPAEIAALVATTRALASRTTQATATGQFREAVTRGSNGYLAVYAAGEHAIVAVIGTTDLNVGMLHFRARATLERIATISAELASQGGSAPYGQNQGHGQAGGDAGQKLPVRRPVRRLS
jgi:hypothetical protein